MHFPFRTPKNQRDYLEPGRSPLIPLTCLLVVVVAVAIVGIELGGRFAAIAGGFVLVGLTTRLPRILPGLAVVTLLIAAFAVVEGGQSAPALASSAHHIASGVLHAHRGAK